MPGVAIPSSVCHRVAVASTSRRRPSSDGWPGARHDRIAPLHAFDLPHEQVVARLLTAVAFSERCFPARKIGGFGDFFAAWPARNPQA